MEVGVTDVVDIFWRYVALGERVDHILGDVGSESKVLGDMFDKAGRETGFPILANTQVEDGLAVGWMLNEERKRGTLYPYSVGYTVENPGQRGVNDPC